MRLSDNRYEDIKQDIVKMFIDSDTRIVPIDVFKLCDRLGYVLKSYSSLGTEKANKIACVYEEGFNRFEEGKVVIYYNDLKIEGRIRFTIMHEVGHIIRKHFFESPLAETEADWFAAYALCPPPIVDKFKVTDSEELVSIFNITNNCAYNSMNRYISWKNRKVKLLDYEEKLVAQFNL